jgi:hypothetical protein
MLTGVPGWNCGCRMTDLIWRRAAGTDVTQLMALTREHYANEVGAVWHIDEQWFASELTVAIARQFFNPGSGLVAVAELDHQVVGWVWAERGIRTVWSGEEMVAIKIVHVSLHLSARQRLQIIQEMMQLWELWTAEIGVGIVCSSSMRTEQQAFVRLHQRRGYDCRGSICYLRLQPNMTDQHADNGNAHTDGADLC